MSKTADEKLNKRLQEIRTWEEKRDEAINKLRELTGLDAIDKTPVTPLPDGLSLQQAIMGVFQADTTGKLQTKEVVKGIEKKYNVSVDRKTVQSTLQYLTTPSKGILEKVARGTYKLINKIS